MRSARSGRQHDLTSEVHTTRRRHAHPRFHRLPRGDLSPAVRLLVDGWRPRRRLGPRRRRARHRDLAAARAALRELGGAAGRARPARARVHGLLRRARDRRRQRPRPPVRPPADPPARHPERRPRVHAHRHRRGRRDRRPGPARCRRSDAAAVADEALAHERHRPAARPAREVPIEHETSSASCGRSSSGCRPPRSWSRAGWRGAGRCTGTTWSCWRSPTRSPGSASPSAIHRLFTHRSFKTTRTVRALLAVLGSMAVEGPVIEWVATHRKHHRFSDQPGDPHSPHVDQAPGWRGALRGLAHAHVGWMFRGKDMANPAPLRQGPARRPRPALHQPHLPALGRGRAGRPVRARRRAHRHRSRAGSRGCCGAEPCASSCSIT